MINLFDSLLSAFRETDFFNEIYQSDRKIKKIDSIENRNIE